MSKNKKVVQINETELVNLIDNILGEAIKEKKKQWIAEQKNNSTNVLESKIVELEKKVNKLTESKKPTTKKAAPKATK
jgi:hypothetical protein